MATGSLIGLALAAMLLLGCGRDEDGGGETARPTTTASAEPDPERAVTTPAPDRERRKRGTRIKVIDSQFGPILGDRHGQAVYLFDKEQSRASECYGDCARAWPPLLTKGRPVAGKRVRQSLLGTTRRRNGTRQVTYGGQPLYYYVDDAPGRVLCHNVLEFGGLWLVVRPNGKPAG